MNLVQSLADIVGASHVITEAGELAPYLTDWRRQFRGTAECVVRPTTTAEAAAVVACCAGAGVAIVPQGGNTGLSGGSVPTGRQREVVVSLARMNRIRRIDPLDDAIVAEAGCVLEAIQREARAAGRLFPLSLAAEGSCTIGGNLSTNAGGINVLRYGMAREQVLGLEVVLPDGRIWDGLRTLRKDNTGYDLKQLFLGAEGTLGLITAAALRLHPLPQAQATAWMAVEDPHAAVRLLARMREALGDRISAFELISADCLLAVMRHAPATRAPLAGTHPWHVLMELADSGTAPALQERLQAALEQCAAEGTLRDAALASSLEQSRALWRIRETIPEAQFTNVKHDLSVPVSALGAFVERALAALGAAFPGCRPFVFGHVGDGNLHFNVGPAELVGRRAEVNRLLYDLVALHGGSVSAEHGVGQLKREEIRRHKGEVEIELMRALKAALDPRGLMNPGKVL